MDWISIRNEYVNTDISYRKLAAKHKVSFNTLKDRATKEHWKAEHDKQHHNTTIAIQQKTTEKIVKKEMNRIEKLIGISDALLKMISTATGELNKNENNELKQVDTYKLRQITASLKDIKDIQATSNDSGTDAPKVIDDI